MKKYLLITTTILCFHSSFGQEVQWTQDTISNKKSEKYKYQSIDQYDQKLLFKLGSVGGVILSDFNSFEFPVDRFAVEYKLSNMLSIEGACYLSEFNASALSAKVRRYFKKSQRANNLSGNYLALEYLTLVGEQRRYTSFNDIYLIHFGNQIKKSRFGYADFKVFSQYQRDDLGGSFSVGMNFILGTSWGPLGPRNEDLKMDEWTAKKAENWLFTLENPFLQITNTFGSVGLLVSMEKELFLTGLTARVMFSSSFSEQSVNEFFFRNSSFRVSSELRKYLGTIGKRGFESVHRPFSGIYAGTGIGSLYTYENINHNFDNSTIPESVEYRGNERQVPFARIGYQERFGKRYFFDLSLNYAFRPIVSSIENTRGPNVLSFSTRVGFAWGR